MVEMINRRATMVASTPISPEKWDEIGQDDFAQVLTSLFQATFSEDGQPFETDAVSLIPEIQPGSNITKAYKSS